MTQTGPSLDALVQGISELRQQGKYITLLGIGPMSRRAIGSALKVSAQCEFPLELIATRSQIDHDGGYVDGLTQQDLVEVVKAETPAGYHGWVHLCADHYGPGFKQGEKGVPAEQCMDAVRASCLSALEAGWGLLHLDLTLDPAVSGEVPLSLITQRTHELWSLVEAGRQERGLPPVSYEVGSEPTSGELTNADTFAELLDAVREIKPLFVVGHIGPHIRMNLNVGCTDLPRARELYDALSGVSAAWGFPCGLKVHNVDYSSVDLLKHYAYHGVTAANVGPSLVADEIGAHLELAARAGKAGREFVSLLQDCVLRSERYKKWVFQDVPPEQIRSDEYLLGWVTRVAGHYELSRPEVQEATAELFRAAAGVVEDPPAFVDSAVEQRIKYYAEPLNLVGSIGPLTDRLGLS